MLLIMYPRRFPSYFILFSSAITLVLLCLIAKKTNYEDDGTIRPFVLSWWSPMSSLQRNIESENEQHYPEAIVTIVTGDLYLPGALVLGYTLNKYGAIKSRRRDMIALVKH